MADLTLMIPRGWEALTDSQLRDVYRLMGRGLTYIDIQTRLLLKWGGIRIEGMDPEREGQHHISVKRECVRCGEPETAGRRGRLHLTVTSDEMHSLVKSLDWLREIPKRPVRPSRVRGRMVRGLMLEGMTFEDFIVIDNRLQGWIMSNSHEQLAALTDMLFPPKRMLRLRRRLIRREPPNTGWLGTAAVQWIISVKLALARLYPNFLKPTGKGESRNGPRLGESRESVMSRVDAQLRALTKGDITKEDAVRRMPYIRALAELDALARESEELRERMKR